MEIKKVGSQMLSMRMDIRTKIDDEIVPRSYIAEMVMAGIRPRIVAPVKFRVKEAIWDQLDPELT